MVASTSTTSPGPNETPANPSSSPVESMPVHLVPADIKVKKELNVRRFDTEDSREEEEKAVQRLAKSLLTEGQIHALIVRQEKSGYSLVDGHRRRKAGELINSGALKSLYDPKKQGPFMLRAEVTEKSDQEAKRAAIVTTIQRKGFSPMELLVLIQDARAENGWDKPENTKDVADYFHVSSATITETEKLQELPKSLKAQVHTGEMSANAALLLVKKVDEPKKDQVAADAKKLAKAEAVSKSAKAQTNTQLSKSQKVAAAKSAEKPKIQKKHIEKAARKAGALKEREPRKKADILEFFDGMGGAGSPPVMAAFCRYLVDTFAKGGGTEGKLTSLWDAIAEALPKSAQGKTTIKDDKKAA